MSRLLYLGSIFNIVFLDVLLFFVFRNSEYKVTLYYQNPKNLQKNSLYVKVSNLSDVLISFVRGCLIILPCSPSMLETDL